MKKALIIFLYIFTYIVLFLSFMPKQMPDRQRMINDIEADQEGGYLLAENKEYVNLIYAADFNRNISRIYSHSNRRGQQTGRIAGIECAEDGSVYYLEIWNKSQEKYLEIYRLTGSWDGQELVGTLKCPQELTIGSFCVKDDELLLSLVDSYDGYVLAYSTSAGTDTYELKERFKRRQTDGDTVVDSVFDGSFLYTLCSGGDITRYTEKTVKGYEVKADGEVFWTAGLPEGLLYCGREEGIRYLNGQEDIQILALSGNYVIDADMTADMEHTAALIGDEEDMRVVFDGGRSCRLDAGFKLSASAAAGLLLRPLLALTGIWLSAAALLTALMYIIKRRRRIAVHAVTCMAAANIAFVAGLTVFLYQNTRTLMEKSRQISNTLFNYEVIERLWKENIDAVDWDSYAGSEKFSQISEQLYDMWIQDDPEDINSQVSFKAMLIYADEEDAYVLNSWSEAYGRKLRSIMDAEVIRNALLLKGSDGYITLIPEGSSERRGYVLTTNFTSHPGVYMLTEASMQDLDMRCGRIWVLSVKRACAYGGVVLLAMGIFLAFLLRPVKKIRYSMGKVASGMYELPDVRMPDNEFGAMWIYLHKMCKALKVQEYSRDNVLNYYYKFVPKGFERLFGRERLQEVAPGESASVEASVCILSLAGEDSLLNGGKIRSYVGSMNSLLGMIGECCGRNGGILLADSSHFESVRAVYQDAAGGTERAAAFAVDSLRGLEEREELSCGLEPSALLHTGNFLCGLAGKGEQLYPFVTSQELTELWPYVDFFKELGVKMAATTEAAGRLRGSYSLRYIGYVGSDRTDKRFGIYEVLDVCADRERSLKQELSGLFGEGLGLFYEREYYRARGCFAGVLKRCREDYVARWYLFRCEALFETKDGGEADHSLKRQDGGL